MEDIELEAFTLEGFIKVAMGILEGFYFCIDYNNSSISLHAIYTKKFLGSMI
jgi:hypothetical protein